MRNILSTGLVAILVLAGGYMILGPSGPHMSWARGLGGMGGGGYGRGGGCPMSYQGTPGGGDFTPGQNLTNNPGNSNGEIKSMDRARDILSGFLARLNPSLRAGKGVDAGSAYEFEVRSGDKVVDRMAVDKSTGVVKPPR